MDTIDHPFDSYSMGKSPLREASPTRNLKAPSITLSTDSYSSGEMNSLHTGNCMRNDTDVSTLNPPIHYRSNFTAKGYVPPATHSSPARLPPPLTHKATDWNDEGIPFDELPFDQQHRIAVKPLGRVRNTATSQFESALAQISDNLSAGPEKRLSKSREMLSSRLDNDIPSTTPRDVNSDIDYHSLEKPMCRTYYSETDDSAAFLAPPKTRRVTTQPNSSDRYNNSRMRSTDACAFPLDEIPVISNRKQYRNTRSEPVTRKLESRYNNESLHTSDCDPQFEPHIHSKQDYEEFGLSPGSVTEDGSKSRCSETKRFSAKNESQSVLILESNTLSPSGDDDSLFDFGDDESRKLSMQLPASDMIYDIQPCTARANAATIQRRSRRSKRHPIAVHDDSDADTSLDADYGVIRHRSSSLQERAQQAFKTRHPRVKERAQSNPKKRHSNVGTPTVTFEQKNVIRFPQQEEHGEYATRNTEKVNVTQGNFEYIKSIESEVEDAIKDLLFIGSGKSSVPGRRKAKGQPDRTRDAQSALPDDSTLNDSITLNTLDESTIDGTSFTSLQAKNQSRTENGFVPSLKKRPMGSADDPTSRVKKSGNEVDTLTVVWTLVEDSMIAMGAVLGLSSAVKDKTKSRGKVGSETTISKELGETNLEKPSVAPISVHSKDRPSFDSIEAVGRSASDMFANISSKISRPHEEGNKAVVDLRSRSCTNALEGDSRLSDFVLHIARSVHSLHGLVFDETVNPDVMTKMEFVYVKVSLPLGILFQENSGGCWVAKVFPGGNAASANVRVGDQLGAIDGNSTIKMNVDGICKAVSDALNPNSIELTFLRYHGPVRPIHPPTIDKNTELEMPLFEEVTEEYALEVLSITAEEPIYCVEIPPKMEFNDNTIPESKKKLQKTKIGRKKKQRKQSHDIGDTKKRGLGRLFSRK